MPTRQLAFLVEDNPLIRRNLVPAMADMADVDVVDFAETQAGALAWLRSHDGEVQVIVLDMFLAAGSGLGVLEGLKAAGSCTPVVVLTNHDTPDMRRRCALAGANAFFDKARQTDEFFEYSRTSLPHTSDFH